MIGIYKIQNKINGKIYIGQSNNIERRLKEHCCPEAYKRSRIPVDIAIHKYGKENFIFEVVEECSLEQLNQREEFWIQYFNSYKTGYNCSKGGEQQSIGSNNGRACLTEEDVVEIRKAYARHERQKEVYKKYKDKIKFSSFQGVWRGYCWKHIMPEVFTEENRNYYIYENSQGERSSFACFTDEEVSSYRRRYQFESANELYPEVQDKVTYSTFQKILCDPTLYPNATFYGKAPKPILSDEQVKQAREFYMTHSSKKTYENFDFAKKIPYGTFKQMLEGMRYYHLPWYSKKYKRWVPAENITCTDYAPGQMRRGSKAAIDTQ